MAQARDAQLPMVFIAPDENFSAGPVFVARNREAARTLTEHLIALGHRRFAFLGGPEKTADAIERLGGLREALSARELELEAATRAFGESFPARADRARSRRSGWQRRARRRRPR